MRPGSPPRADRASQRSWSTTPFPAPTSRRLFRQSETSNRAAAVVVVAAFCVGPGLAAGPSTQRHLEADQRRFRDLKAVVSAVHARFVGNAGSGRLPSSVGELVRFHRRGRAGLGMVAGDGVASGGRD